ncbi:MAG TPA: BMP family ABC transporter substrate-binding protein, partial [Sphaerochaeta sp.]|nr:BMP family ABC transporter substrate-binding protein [Sphaerochaeta sp.]
MKKGIVLLLIVLLVSMVAFGQGSKDKASTADAVLKVGVIYISPPGDMGYSYMHDQGTIAMEE